MNIEILEPEDLEEVEDLCGDCGQQPRVVLLEQESKARHVCKACLGGVMEEFLKGLPGPALVVMPDLGTEFFVNAIKARQRKNRAKQVKPKRQAKRNSARR